MKKIIVIFILGFIGAALLFYSIRGINIAQLGFIQQFGKQSWEIQSIDTMKSSRDSAREKLHDPLFDTVIDTQMKNIAATGANYVAIGTPYDEEFYPFLTRWVQSARKYNLRVWFRGNFSGWEGWFGYPRISREMHIEKTKAFIVNNKDLFEDGDIFTSCPECENGIPISYSDTGSLHAHREFLLREYNMVKSLFSQIGKDVKANYYSMNGDVAKAIMDKPTTAAFDGVVVIDHYVETPSQLAHDVRFLAAQSGGSIILGEFGAPIPDIHGTISEEEQAAWIDEALQELKGIPEVKGINYWVNHGGTTEIWRSTGQPKSAVAVLTKYYSQRKFF